MSEAIQESGQSPDSQKTISDNSFTWNWMASVALLFQAFDSVEIKGKSKTASSLFTLHD